MIFQMTIEEPGAAKGMFLSNIRDHDISKVNGVWRVAASSLEAELKNMGPYEFACYWWNEKIEKHWQLLEELVGTMLTQ